MTTMRIGAVAEGCRITRCDMTGIWRKIVQRAIAGLSAAVLAGTAALAQAPRSVTILPDVPEAPAATRAPDISPMRLEPLNASVKGQKAGGGSRGPLAQPERSLGFQTGFLISPPNKGLLVPLPPGANATVVPPIPHP